MTGGAVDRKSKRLQPAPPVLLRVTGGPFCADFVCVPAVAFAPIPAVCRITIEPLESTLN
jgi:hypothetical protein